MAGYSNTRVKNRGKTEMIITLLYSKSSKFILFNFYFRHVREEDKKSKPSMDSRDELLDQIRSGVTLKKVELDNKSEGACSSNENPSGIAGMLQKALRERTTALNFSSSEDENNEADDDDDEWDD